MRMTVALAATCAIVGLANAKESSAALKQYDLNIPRQSLDLALKTLAEQTGLQIARLSQSADGDAVVGPVSGSLTPGEALELLLKEKGLTFQVVDGKTIAVLRKGEGKRLRTSSVGQDARAAQSNSSGGTDEPHADSSVREEDHSAKLEEIVVTATKRAESLQKIPLSVTAIDEHLLERTGAVNLVDYGTRVPNLSFGATGDQALSMYSMQIRGVAGNETTGFYIDDLPIPESMNPRVMDISRVEVLRGPQGSLYGARSMGGTVRLITKRADPRAQEFKAHASIASVAEGEQDYALDTAFNLPISTNAAFRGNLYFQRESGIHDVVVNNPTLSGDETAHENADKAEHWGLQAAVTWNVTDRFTVEPRIMYQKSHLDWLPYSDHRPGNFTIRRVSNLADDQDQEWGTGSLTLTWDVGWGRLTSATGFFKRNNNSSEEWSEWVNYFSGLLGGDPDYYPPGGLLFTLDGKFRQITEELRFTSDFDGPWKLTAGIFYSDNKTNVLAPCSGSTAVGIIEATGFPFGTECLFFADYEIAVEELAFFGELEYALRDNLLLTVGGRYFDNRNRDSRLQTGALVDFGAPSRPRSVGEQKESGFNPKLALTWYVEQDWTLYGSAAKGFRVGGVNIFPPPPALCGPQLEALGISGTPDTYDSDSLWSYELGSKSNHFGGRLAFNAAAFFIDWSDIIQTTLLECGLNFTNNTGKAEIKGFETEVSARPTDNLSVSLGVGYADAQITDPEAAAGVRKGDPLAQVPEWTFSSNAEYGFPVGTHQGYFFLSYSWIDESTSFNSGRGSPRVRDAYDLIDARLGMRLGNLDISLFGKNLANKHANLSDQRALTIEVPDRPRYVISRPRTIGIDARWAF